MRNVKLLRPEPNSLLCTFPYDFDFSGFVSATYAIPNPDYKLKNIKQRVFLAKMYSEEETKYTVAMVNKGIMSLPNGYREIISLYLLEGYDHNEIAEILGISNSTSKSQYARAKKKLRELLSAQANG